MLNWVRRLPMGLIILIGVFDADLVAAAVLKQAQQSLSDPELNQLHYWVQIFSGNWSHQDAYPQRSFIYCLLITTSIILNFGPMLAILAWAYNISRYLTEQKEQHAMLFGQAMTELLDTDRQALFEEFGDDEVTARRIDTALLKSREALRPQITAVFGKEAAARFFAALRNEV